ncbi:MAG TPA: response regulator [Candidatus Saccharimonadales bacterium]|nr:response regulator [Candidatus Saccharimonadales bacterium]
MSIEDKYDTLNYINGTILIVTDDIDINIVLSGVFGLNGFKCFKCNTAEEALKILDEHVDKVDSMLIDGKIAADRGTMIIVKSKTKKPSVKIVVVANNDSAKTRVLDYGADDFSLKPISAEVLTNRVITQLTRR